MSKTDVLNILKNIGDAAGIELVCLVRRNGDTLGSAGDITARQLESFGIMSATIYGAANTANEQLGKQRPEWIIIKGKDGNTVISKVDEYHVLVVRVAPDKEMEHILQDIDRFIVSLNDEWGR